MSYIPTVWKSGDIVSSEKLNKLEQGVADATSESIIVEETDAWLEENIAQETGYALDSSLTMSNAAAPADKVGELKTAVADMSETVNGVSNYVQGKKLKSAAPDKGTVVSDENFDTSDFVSLSLIPSGTVITIDYGAVSETTIIGVYNSNKQFIDSWALQSTATSRTITFTYSSYTDPAYLRFSFKHGYNAKITHVNNGTIYWNKQYSKLPINERVTSLEEKVDDIEEREAYPTDVISVINGIAIAGESGGVIPDYADYVASDYIPLWGCGGKNIKFNACLYSNVGFAVYDKDGEYLYGISGGTASSYGYENQAATQAITMTLPDRAAFIRITLRKEYYSSVSDFGVSLEFDNPIPIYNALVDSRLIEDVKKPNSYYFEDDYLPNKCTAINNALDLYAADGDAFMFFTDQHWFDNAKQSPSLIRYIEKNCNIYRLFCGGDSFDHGSVEFVKDVNDAFHGRIHHVMGNHEYFYPTTGDQLYRMYDMDHPNQIGDNGRHYYYVDNHQSKIRYIILSAYDNGTSEQTVTSGYEQEQLTWLSGVLQDSPYDVIVFTHDMDTTHSLNLPVINALDTYKSGGGTVIGIICGHKHWDELEFTDGDIPIITVQCDKNDPWIVGGVDQEPFLSDRTTGTIKEQVVDTFVIDRTNRKIHQIRTGCPIRYGTDPSEWTELESTEISY